MTFCCKSLKHNCEATNKNRNEKVFLLLKKIHSLILFYLSEYYQHFHTGKIVCMKSSLRIVIKFYIVLYFLSSFMFEIQYFLYFFNTFFCFLPPPQAVLLYCLFHFFQARFFHWVQQHEVCNKQITLSVRIQIKYRLIQNNADCSTHLCCALKSFRILHKPIKSVM